MLNPGPPASSPATVADLERAAGSKHRMPAEGVGGLIL